MSVIGLDTTVVPGNTTGSRCRPTTGRIDSQRPNAHDYEQLKIIYAHLDGGIAGEPPTDFANLIYLSDSAGTAAAPPLHPALYSR